MAPLVMTGLLVGLGAGPASALTCGGWTVVPSPSPGSVVNVLNGVAAVSAANAWAVGEHANHRPGPYKTLIERWDGTAWKQVPSPNPARSTNPSLNGAAATSAASAWAVGSYSTRTQAKTLIEQWNGTAWKIVPSPSPGTATTLAGVAATSAANAWAVGSYTTRTAGLPLIEHWDGTAWKQVPSPNPAGGSEAELDGVAATSAANAWAVGSYDRGTQTLIEHWNGTAWKIVPSPNPGPNGGPNALFGVAATSAADAWAVGHMCTFCATSDQGLQTLILHWDGTAWKQVSSVNMGGLDTGLSGVAATSTGNAWAVGGSGSALGSRSTLTEHWDGTAWKLVPSPNPGISNGFHGLSGVAATSAANVWAVGFKQGTTRFTKSKTLTLHFC